MRPLITFLGLIMIIPGWDLVSIDSSDITNPHFLTSSGTFLWILSGSSHNVNLVHVYGLATIVIGVIIAIFGFFLSPIEKEKPGSLAEY